MGDDIKDIKKESACSNEANKMDKNKTILEKLRQSRPGRYDIPATPFQLKRDFGNGMLATHKAVEDGNLEELKWLIESGAKCLEKDGKNWTLLHRAAHKGNLHIVHYLLGLRDWSRDFKDGIISPLHFACESEHLPIVKALIEEGGFDVDWQNWCCNTPMYYVESNLEIAQYLIDKGADVTLRMGEKNDSYLHMACRKGNLEMAEFLLLNRLNPWTNKDGHLPLQCVPKEKEKEFKELFRKFE